MKHFLILVLFIYSAAAFAQTGIGTTTPNASAKLDVTATDKGFLPPRMTMLQRNSIANPATGLLLFQTDGVVGSYINTGTPALPGWQLMAAPPTGTVNAFAGSTAPSGYLFCDGTAVSRSTFALLFAVIGTTYGIGDGSSTFNVPDLRGRTIIGTGTGSGLTTRTLAARAGAESHTLTTSEMPVHNHGISDPGHSHSQNTTNDDFNNSGGNPPGFSADGAGSRTWSNINSSTTGISINNNGGGGAHNLMNPFMALNYIIKF